MKKLLGIVFVFLSVQWHSQAQLNGYKYIVVPTKFETFKNENQFRTSTLIKYLFSNEGFNTVYSNNLPQDLADEPCLGLMVDLIDDSTLFATNTSLSLTDCNNVVVLMTQKGRSKTKEFEQAYREALSEAFGSLRGLNYKYEPSEPTAKSAEPITVSFKNDVKSLEPKDADKKEKEAHTGVEPSVEEPLPAVASIGDSKEKDILYAQPITDGYQLVDTTPKVVFILKKTSAPEVFLVSKDGKSGVVYKNDGKWFVEMDDKGGRPKELNIKF